MEKIPAPGWALRDAKCDNAMKNKNLVVTIGVVIVGAVLAWFGFGDKMVQQTEKAEPQEVATTTPSQTSSQTPSTSGETTKTETADKSASADGEAKKEGDDKPSEAAKDDKSAETAPAAVADMKKAEKTASDDAAKAPAADAEAGKAEASTKSEEMAAGEKKPAEEVADKAADAMAKSADAKPEEKASDAAKSAEDALTTGAIVPSFDVVRVEPDGNTLVAGKAAPGSIVELMNGDNVLAKATADDSGAWVMILEEALRKGVHDLSLAAKAEEGADPVVSKSNIAVAIPESGELLVVESEPGQASKILAQIAKSQPKQVVAKVADDTAGKVAEMAEKPAEAAEKGMEKAGEAVDAAKAMADKADDMTKKAMAEADASAANKEATEKPAKMADKASAAADPKADATEMAKKEPAKEEMAKEKPVEPVQASVSVKAIELEGDVLYVAGDAKPAGSVLRLYVDNRAISDSESSEAGTFLFDGPISLDVGSHDVRVDLLSGPDGKVLTRAQVSFEKKAPVMAKKDTPSNGSAEQDTGTNGQITNAVATDANGDTAPQVVNSRKVIIRRGDNLWEIARRVYGAGVRYSTIYDGNTEQIRDPHWIYPGQVFDLPEGEEGWEQNFDAVEAPSAEETNSQ